MKYARLIILIPIIVAVSVAAVAVAVILIAWEAAIGPISADDGYID